LFLQQVQEIASWRGVGLLLFLSPLGAALGASVKTTSVRESSEGWMEGWKKIREFFSFSSGSSIHPSKHWIGSDWMKEEKKISLAC
jgi:hypothetical protein